MNLNALAEDLTDHRGEAIERDLVFTGGGALARRNRKWLLKRGGRAKKRTLNVEPETKNQKTS